MNQYPDINEFIFGPIENIRKVAPSTTIFVAGGTRRKAVSMGLSTESDEYGAWTRQEMITCFDLIFKHGVKHIFTPLVGPTNFSEVGIYREKLLEWIVWGVSGEQALADYARLGWRVRLITDENIPQLQQAAEQLRTVTPRTYEHTLWVFVIPEAGIAWQWLLAAAHRTQARTHQELIKALYGEDVPPAQLYLGHGKPEIFEQTLPILATKVLCYWRQSLGYDLDERMLRTILYDYAYTRATWREDKAGRAEEAMKYSDIWQDSPVVGLGVRVGPFWYPAPIASLNDV